MNRRLVLIIVLVMLVALVAFFLFGATLSRAPNQINFDGQ